MKNLKNDTLNKCFSLLKVFIDEADGLNHQKGTARLALNELEKITAGGDKAGSGSEKNGGDSIAAVCVGRPRAEISFPFE